jgi:hypothetical protein
MPKSRVLTAPLLSLVLLIIFGVQAFGQTPVAAAAPEITFTVAMSRPHTHLFDIDVSIKRGPTATAPAEELLVMPVWTPGSYLIREFQRHVQDF